MKFCARAHEKCIKHLLILIHFRDNVYSNVLLTLYGGVNAIVEKEEEDWWRFGEDEEVKILMEFVEQHEVCRCRKPRSMNQANF
jgi:hypothetical protein